MSIYYDTIGRSIVVRGSIDAMDNRSLINILHTVLVRYDPGAGHPDYEQYQEACKVVLDRANEFWDK